MLVLYAYTCQAQHAKAHSTTSLTPALSSSALTVMHSLLHRIMQVTSTYQLIGKFLSLKGEDVEGDVVQTVEHCDRFWYWLKEVGIVAHRSGIVNAIAEKCNTWLPGIYDEAQYEG